MKKNILSILLFSFLSMIIFSCKNPLLIEESGLYEVTFETNGGTQISKYRTNCIKISPVTQKNNYVFSGWYDTSNYKNEPICFPYDINEDTILYAKWTEYHKVTFNTNGGTTINNYVTDKILEFPKSTKKGYYLEGWYETSDFIGRKIDFPYVVTQDIILYANWIENPNAYYKVKHYKQNTNLNLDFDSYILSDTETLSGKVDNQTQAASNDYEGFYPKKIIQTNILIDNSSVAKIYYDRKKCIVSFNSNGGTGKMNSQEFYYEANQILDLNCFENYGYYFIGWALSPNGEVQYNDGEKISVKKDTTLYAKWKSGITVTNNSVKNLDLSLLTNDCIIKFEGEISDSVIETLVEKIKISQVDIFLDLSETKNLTIIKSKTNSTSFFANCPKLESIILPNTVTQIESYAFYDCDFTNIYIPNSVKTIGSYAFYSCDNLTTINLDSVEMIESKAFSNNNLTSIILKNIHTIGNYAFECSNNLTEMYIDAVIINSSAFSNCPKLSSAIIGKNAIELQYYIFENCSNLYSVTFEDPKNWYYIYEKYTFDRDVSDAYNNACYLKSSTRIWFKK